MVRGKIEFVDMRRGFGNVKGPDDVVYFFSKSALQAKGKPEKDQEVDFVVVEADVGEGKKPVAGEVAPIEDESFNTAPRKRKPRSSNDSSNGESGKKKGNDGAAAKLEALTARMERLESKLDEICDSLKIKKLGGDRSSTESRGKGSKKGKGRKGSKKGKGRKGSKGRKSSGDDDE